jgi:hypothetical protein
MNIINYTKKLAKIHLDKEELIDNDIVKTLQAILDNTLYNISYFEATYGKEITNQLIKKE